MNYNLFLGPNLPDSSELLLTYWVFMIARADCSAHVSVRIIDVRAGAAVRHQL